MKAYHDDAKIKAKYLKRVNSHIKADEVIKGQYWQNGKGCAVGCTIHSGNHSDYEKKLGIPEWLARVEDTIFEGLPNKDAKQWPANFLKAIKPGVNLNKIKTPFLIFVLESNLETLAKIKFDANRFPDVQKAIEQAKDATKLMIKYHKTGKNQARSAAYSARSAAYSAADSARSAAYSAADSARSAADSARSAAYSAARSAAYSAADSAACVKFADKLLSLIKELK